MIIKIVKVHLENSSNLSSPNLKFTNMSPSHRRNLSTLVALLRNLTFDQRQSYRLIHKGAGATAGLLKFKTADNINSERRRGIHTSNSRFNPAKFYSSPVEAVKDIPNGAKLLVGGNEHFLILF